MPSGIQWHLRGHMVGACSCDWGCPCNFNARPTNGWCQGTYAWQIEDGKFGEINLTGLHFIWSGESPGPIHEGHVTTQVVIDSKANSQQREALLRLFHGKDGGPFAIFAAITETVLEPIFAPFEASMYGLESRVSVPGVLEIALTTIKNPVTGEPEKVSLVKPTGFTSESADLGTTTTYRFTGGFQHNHPGKYAEFAPFEYSGS